MVYSLAQHNICDAIPTVCQANLEIQWEQKQTWVKLTVDSSGCRISLGTRIGLTHKPTKELDLAKCRLLFSFHKPHFSGISRTKPS